MKKVWRDFIINIKNTDLFDNRFLFEYLNIDYSHLEGGEVIFMKRELEKRKNEEILLQVKEKPAMYSNVYSPKDELEIFETLFEEAIKNKKRIHIVWVTLDEEIKILEKYYESLGFLRADINCFDPDFWIPLVTVSVNIENLIWKGSDYKAQRNKIFYCPPIRESWQTKAMYKGINRWVIAGIHIWDFNETIESFLSNCIISESILPITLAKVLSFNMEDIWFMWEKNDLEICYKKEEE